MLHGLNEDGCGRVCFMVYFLNMRHSMEFRGRLVIFRPFWLFGLEDGWVVLGVG